MIHQRKKIYWNFVICALEIYWKFLTLDLSTPCSVLTDMCKSASYQVSRGMYREAQS